MIVFWLQMQYRLRREEGQDLTEYALLMALIILIVIVSIRLFGTTINDMLSTIASTLVEEIG